MAQQQIITKPYVGELQDDDSLFINHDGALRQVKKKDADIASSEYVRTYVDNAIKAEDYAFAITKRMMDYQLASVGISAPLTYPYAKTLMAHADHYYGDDYRCVNVLAMAEVINALCEQIDANTSSISSKADSATTLSGYGITDAYTKTETYTKEEVDAALEDKANHKYNQNANVLGVTKTTEQIGDEQAVFKKGGIFGGTAAEAGLVTRGICGITSPDKNGGCTKENLYINYDGGTEYKSDRQMVLQAGNVGAHYGHNLYQYAAARGDAVKGYVDNATVASARNATKATQDSDGNAINTTYRKVSDSYSKSETDAKLTGKADSATLDAKQDKLTFDSEPTKDSTNAITSGGVYKALNGEITVTTQNDNLLDPNDTDNQVAKKVFYTGPSSTQFISLSGDTAIYFPIKKWGAGTYTFPVDYEQYGGSAAYRIALFDASKTYIKTITGTVKDTTDKTAHIMSISVTDSDLSTGYYIGLSIRTTQIGTSAMVVKDMDYPSSYVSYGTITKTYKTQKVDNELVGKSAYFLGDSICAATSVGSSSSLYKKGWAGWVGEKNSMNWVNLGKDGATVSTVSTNTVISQMSSVKSDADYIIVEGGCNDFDQMHGSTDSAKMGALTAVWDDSYTLSTFIGALEHVFYTLVTNHPNAKIGYIIPHIMGRRNWTQYETISYRIYYNQAIEVCKKWGIPYIDLWYESPLNPNLTVYYDASLGNDGNISDGSKAYVDGQHLTGHGYDLISPKIEAWMRTL